jgi:hypothetical protein
MAYRCVVDFRQGRQPNLPSLGLGARRAGESFGRLFDWIPPSPEIHRPSRGESPRSRITSMRPRRGNGE